MVDPNCAIAETLEGLRQVQLVLRHIGKIFHQLLSKGKSLARQNVRPLRISRINQAPGNVLAGSREVGPELGDLRVAANKLVQTGARPFQESQSFIPLTA